MYMKKNVNKWMRKLMIKEKGKKVILSGTVWKQIL